MRPLAPDTGVTQAYNAALTELQKALKAMTFYPEKHPLREDILHKSFQVIDGLAKNGGFSLTVRRNGISFEGRDVKVDNTPMNTALARELFAREVQQLTLLPDISYNEFCEFLSLLALEPHAIISRGGLADILHEKNIRSVVANEIDITTVYTKKTAGSPGEDTTPEGEATQGTDEGYAQEFEIPEATSEDHLADLSMEELIDLMDSEADDYRYRMMAMLLPGKGKLLIEKEDYDCLFRMLPMLLKQNADDRKSVEMRHCAFEMFQHLISGNMTEHLLDHLEDEGFDNKEGVLSILYRAGADVVDAVLSRIVTAEDQSVTKNLNSILVRIGTPALPGITRMLRDSDWHKVRTAVVLLGEMGIRDSAGELINFAYHPDNRIRMEAIRSLARVGGREATTLLLDLLDDKNPAVSKQAILWLGITRNEKALQKLLQLAIKRDITGKIHSLKKEALVAISRIGDRQALEPLCRLVEKRRLIAAERWDELKILAIEAISQLGGDSSREFLEKMENRGGRIGRACSSSLKAMQRPNHAHGETLPMEDAAEMNGP